MMPPARAAIFVDKDGTLVDDVPYNADPALLRFKPGALAALSALAARGFVLLVASNQSGLARGFFTRVQFTLLQAVLERRLLEEAGVALLDVMICPHAPAADGTPQCPCRKPAPGLLLRAARRHRLDLGRSWMVGDTLDDVEAGHRAGCRSILFDSGGETLWRHTPLRRPEVCLGEWDEVVHHILAADAAPARTAAVQP